MKTFKDNTKDFSKAKEYTKARDVKDYDAMLIEYIEKEVLGETDNA